MSAENINKTDMNNVDAVQTPKASSGNNSGRVNINNLLARVREEQKKQNKVNLTFFGIFASLILVVGVILSF
ncbi:MAG: hypothetical protein CBD99_001985 [Candidatus Pelagibacter sp. TMED239]|jgi:hypothetical protein|nr:MAG: hypothetical protein CBD99_001985 [Candidatus Pelagibacter sp. TMED239]|tara:strand:+ start:323 stop:538 length:216 start_codon:yes stop_codon:yes gene_type:complete